MISIVLRKSLWIMLIATGLLWMLLYAGIWVNQTLRHSTGDAAYRVDLEQRLNLLDDTQIAQVQPQSMAASNLEPVVSDQSQAAKPVFGQFKPGLLQGYFDLVLVMVAILASVAWRLALLLAIPWLVVSLKNAIRFKRSGGSWRRLWVIFFWTDAGWHVLHHQQSSLWQSSTLQQLSVSWTSLTSEEEPYIPISDQKIEHTDGYAIGWKAALLTIDVATGRPGLHATAQMAKYKPDAIARCALGKTHESPSLGCTCGFYSFYRRELAEVRLTLNISFVLLRVANTGKMIPKEAGYLSQRQVVTDVWLQPDCVACRCENRDQIQPAVWLVQGDPLIAGQADLAEMIGICLEHAALRPSGNWSITQADLARELRVCVRWLGNNPGQQVAYQPIAALPEVPAPKTPDRLRSQILQPGSAQLN